MVISSAGGSLTSNDADRSVTVGFPPDAVTTDTAVTYAYQPRRITGYFGFDRFFSLTAGPATAQGEAIHFHKPVTITVRHPADSPAFKDLLPLLAQRDGLGNHQHHDHRPHQRLSDQHHRSFHAVRPAGAHQLDLSAHLSLDWQGWPVSARYLPVKVHLAAF